MIYLIKRCALTPACGWQCGVVQDVAVLGLQEGDDEKAKEDGSASVEASFPARGAREAEEFAGAPDARWLEAVIEVSKDERRRRVVLLVVELVRLLAASVLGWLGGSQA